MKYCTLCSNEHVINVHCKMMEVYTCVLTMNVPLWHTVIQNINYKIVYTSFIIECSLIYSHSPTNVNSTAQHL